LCSTATGPGVECDHDLYANPGRRYVTCRACGAEHDVDARRAVLLGAVADQLLTAVEASRALPGLLGRPVTAATVRGLAHRGRLAQRPGGLYRVGDLIDALTAQATRRAVCV
jgi:hypothetical protein